MIIAYGKRKPAKKQMNQLNQRKKEKLLFIYPLLVILTPIYNLPGLPPLRLDDLYLLAFGTIAIANGALSYMLKSLSSRTLFIFFLWATFSFSINTLRFDQGLWQGISPLLVIVRLLLIGMLVNWVIKGSNSGENTLKGVYRAVLIGACISAAIYLLQVYRVPGLGLILTGIYSGFGEKYIGGYFTGGGLFRAPGTMGNPNFQASLMAVTFLCGWSLARRSKVTLKNTCIFIGIGSLMLVALLATGSRTGLAATLAGVAGFEALLLLRSGLKIKTLFFAITLSCLVFVLVSMDTPLSRVTSRAIEVLNLQEESLVDKIEQSRGLVWRYSLNRIDSEDLWLFGSGVEPDFVIDSGYIRNIYQYGIVGLAIVCFLYILIGRMLVRKKFGHLSESHIGGLCLVFVCIIIEFTFGIIWTAKLGPIVLYLFFWNDGLLSKQSFYQSAPRMRGSEIPRYN